MAQAALLVIDVQQSFLHRDFWRETDFPAFQRSISALIEGCEGKGIPVVDVFHVAPQGPFSLASGWVKRIDFLQHQATFSVQKRVHNALTESGQLPWLQAREIDTLIISGIRTEQCCETTASVASDLGFKVLFVSEATRIFPMTHDGITLSCAELIHRTETVLVNRFAELLSVEA
ncbi:isochorismatase family protein [Candidatus Pantoea persica]|uniref:isochorismatase family protein n=1 Tax=Candidatus Pantoea persica TaxID=2518128 RepID=UPI00215D6A19|nr:isochorismatase family protein [Candidatus Pantoea persica]MBA2817858.1 nicotinamidase/pyrazinamidase [Candidatus Pantoea persica]